MVNVGSGTEAMKTCARRRRHDHEEKEGEEREAMRQGHRQMITDL
jgi:hypothetical protein